MLKVKLNNKSMELITGQKVRIRMPKLTGAWKRCFNENTEKIYEVIIARIYKKVVSEISNEEVLMFALENINRSMPLGEYTRFEIKKMICAEDKEEDLKKINI